jgi:DNA-binding transcriptional ArsR family regulator
VVSIDLSAGAMARIRFAVSPLWETIASIRVLRDPGAHAIHLPWAARMRGLRYPELFALVPAAPGYIPDFLTPMPPGPFADLDEELQALAATPPGVAAGQAALAAPASTSVLAARTGLTAGGVSQHLAVLRAAGLVRTHRSGRTVLNVRTGTAEALLAADASA